MDNYWIWLGVVAVLFIVMKYVNRDSQNDPND